MAKLPSFQFYPGDWLKDPNLRRCSIEARGAWIDALCIAFGTDERGVFVSGGVVWSIEDVAAAVPGDPKQNRRLVQELISKGVMKQREDGAFFSARMVRDEQKRLNLSDIRGEAGRKGMANRWQTDNKPISNAITNDNLSSSSSDLSSDKEKKEPPTAAVSVAQVETQAKASKPKYPPAFEAFWEAFPNGRKSAKHGAYKAFVVAVSRLAGIQPDPAAWLTRRAAEYAASPRGRSEYVRGPTPWLSQGCYDDHPDAWADDGRDKPKERALEAAQGDWGMPENRTELETFRIQQRIPENTPKADIAMRWVIGNKIVNSITPRKFAQFWDRNECGTPEQLSEIGKLAYGENFDEESKPTSGAANGHVRAARPVRARV